MTLLIITHNLINFLLHAGALPRIDGMMADYTRIRSVCWSIVNQLTNESLALSFSQSFSARVA